MIDIVEPLSAAGGGIFGVVLAYLGIKSRVDRIEKTLENLVSEKECFARTSMIAQRVDNSVLRFNKIDDRLENIQVILLENVKK